jgi:peptidoglycan/xylan/chitin deacetylase (PgdA/CDA1 family)
MRSRRPSPAAQVSSTAVSSAAVPSTAVSSTAVPTGAAQPSPLASTTLGRWLPTPLLRGSALVHLAALGLAAAGRWRWAAAAVFADHLVLAAASMAPRSGLLGPLLTRLPAEAAARGEVALTFDDGPDPRATPAVLDLLDEAGHRASFFLIGRRAAAHPELVAEIVRRGHAVENHSNRHQHTFAFLMLGGLRRDLCASQAAITALTGRAPRFFRPPMGFRNPLLDPVLHEMGLALVSWTRRGFDTYWGDPDDVAMLLARGLAAGDILLLHDSHAAPTPDGKPVVLEVLPRLLDAIRRQGLKPVTLPQAIDS